MWPGCRRAGHVENSVGLIQPRCAIQFTLEPVLQQARNLVRVLHTVHLWPEAGPVQGGDCRHHIGEAARSSASARSHACRSLPRGKEAPGSGNRLRGGGGLKDSCLPACVTTCVARCVTIGGIRLLGAKTLCFQRLAERVGFEPTEPAKAQRFSRPPRSTTLAPLQARGGGLISEPPRLRQRQSDWL